MNFIAMLILKDNGTNTFTIEYLQNYTFWDSQYI